MEIAEMEDFLREIRSLGHESSLNEKARLPNLRIVGGIQIFRSNLEIFPFC